MAAHAQLDLGDEDFPIALALADVVAARHDELLVYPGSENRTERQPWPPPLRLPYAVFVVQEGRFHTLPLDFDSGRGDAARDATWCAQMLTDLGIRHVRTTSGPSGGQHLLVPLEGGAVTATEARVIGLSLQAAGCSSIDLGPICNERRGAIRPPLAPHRKGGYSAPYDLDPWEALSVLGDPNGPRPMRSLVAQLRDLVTLPEPVRFQGEAGPVLRQSSPRPISGRIRDLSQRCDTSGRYRSTSEARFALACAMATQGRTKAEFFQWVRGGWLSDHKGKPATERYLDGEWDRAEAFAVAAVLRTNGLAARIARAVEWTANRHWSGRSDGAARNRKAFACLLEMSSSLGKLQFDMSERQLARRMGVGARTAGRALSALRDEGLVTRLVVGQPCFSRANFPGGRLDPRTVSGNASTWRLELLAEPISDALFPRGDLEQEVPLGARASLNPPNRCNASNGAGRQLGSRSPRQRRIDPRFGRQLMARLSCRLPPRSGGRSTECVTRADVDSAANGRISIGRRCNRGRKPAVCPAASAVRRRRLHFLRSTVRP
jgi:DNA-binding transcriptional ArsR family regulator